MHEVYGELGEEKSSEITSQNDLEERMKFLEEKVEYIRSKLNLSITSQNQSDLEERVKVLEERLDKLISVLKDCSVRSISKLI